MFQLHFPFYRADVSLTTDLNIYLFGAISAVTSAISKADAVGAGAGPSLPHSLFSLLAVVLLCYRRPRRQLQGAAQALPWMLQLCPSEGRMGRGEPVRNGVVLYSKRG